MAVELSSGSKNHVKTTNLYTLVLNVIIHAKERLHIKQIISSLGHEAIAFVFWLLKLFSSEVALKRLEET